MAEVNLQLSLIEKEIPEGRKALRDGHENLAKVAAYCEQKYLDTNERFKKDPDRNKCLEETSSVLKETKQYATQSLASVAYQINTLAVNMLNLLDQQALQLSQMESRIHHIAETVTIHKEKVARREIGVLATSKNTGRTHRIIAPSEQEKPKRYGRKPIDYSALDDIGHGVKIPTEEQRRRQSASARRATASKPAPSPHGTLSKKVPPLRKTVKNLPPPPVPPPSIPSVPPPSVPSIPPDANVYEAPPSSSSNPSQVPHSPWVHASPVSPPKVPPLPNVTNHGPTPSVPAPPVVMPPAPPPPPPTVPTVTLPPPDVIPSSEVGQGDDVYEVMSGKSNPGTGNVDSVLSLSDVIPSLRLDQADDTYEVMNGDNGKADDVMNPFPPPPPPVEDFYQSPSSLPMPSPPDDMYQSPSAVPGPPPPPLEAGAEPAEYIEKVMAIYDYQAQRDDELTFAEGAIIYVIKKNDDGWYEGVMGPETGLFPGNYVEVCS